jgi:hypothetical protein
MLEISYEFPTEALCGIFLHKSETFPPYFVSHASFMYLINPLIDHIESQGIIVSVRSGYWGCVPYPFG